MLICHKKRKEQIMAKDKIKAEKPKRNIAKGIDTIVYGLSMIVLSTLAVAGVMMFLQPVEQMLSIPISTVLVGLLLYVALKAR